MTSSSSFMIYTSVVNNTQNFRSVALFEAFESRGRETQESGHDSTLPTSVNHELPLSALAAWLHYFSSSLLAASASTRYPPPPHAEFWRWIASATSLLPPTTLSSICNLCPFCAKLPQGGRVSQDLGHMSLTCVFFVSFFFLLCWASNWVQLWSTDTSFSISYRVRYVLICGYVLRHVNAISENSFFLIK